MYMKEKILKKKLSKYQVSFIVILFLFFGCGAYFNTFYNTKKLFNAAEKKRLSQEKQNKKTGINVQARTPSKISEYSKAIEKGSKVLELHPKSRYVDDAIMIIGKSFYHTGDYIKAQRKFEELINFLPNSEYLPDAKLWLRPAVRSLMAARTTAADRRRHYEARMEMGDKEKWQTFPTSWC